MHLGVGESLKELLAYLDPIPPPPNALFLKTEPKGEGLDGRFALEQNGSEAFRTQHRPKEFKGHSNA